MVSDNGRRRPRDGSLRCRADSQRDRAGAFQDCRRREHLLGRNHHAGRNLLVRCRVCATTVLDIGTLTLGKFCTSMLADMGASVLRIERPSEKGGALSREDLALNRGKRSLTLDLRADEGREVVLRLADRCDCVIESYRPGVAKRLGIDYPILSARNPRLVYCSLSGFGESFAHPSPELRLLQPMLRRLEEDCPTSDLRERPSRPA